MLFLNDNKFTLYAESSDKVNNHNIASAKIIMYHECPTDHNGCCENMFVSDIYSILNYKSLIGTDKYYIADISITLNDNCSIGGKHWTIDENKQVCSTDLITKFISEIIDTVSLTFCKNPNTHIVFVTRIYIPDSETMLKENKFLIDYNREISRYKYLHTSFTNCYFWGVNDFCDFEFSDPLIYVKNKDGMMAYKYIIEQVHENDNWRIKMCESLEASTEEESNDQNNSVPVT